MSFSIKELASQALNKRLTAAAAVALLSAAAPAALPLKVGRLATPPQPASNPYLSSHLVCGESARSTLSRGPWPSFSVTSCRFSMARAAEDARSYFT